MTNPNDFPVNFEEIDEFFGIIFEPGDWVEFRAIRPTRNYGNNPSAYAPVPLESTLVKHWIETHHRPTFQGMYFGANPRKVRRAAGSGRASDESDVATYRCAFVDLDNRAPQQAVELVAANGIAEPTLVVHSGRETGTHLYWRFTTPMDREEWEGVQRGLQLRLGGDSVKDPPRVMRLAGTYNFKRENMARILRRGPRYETFEALGLTADEMMPPVFVTPTGDVEPDENNLNYSTRKYLEADEIPEGGNDEFVGRNNALFSAACDFIANSFSLEDTIERLSPLAVDRDGLSEYEAKRTIHNAARRNPSRTLMAGINAHDLTLRDLEREFREVRRGMAPQGTVPESFDDVPELRRTLEPMSESELTAAHADRETTTEEEPDEGKAQSADNDLPAYPTTDETAAEFSRALAAEQDEQATLYDELQSSVPMLLANFKRDTIQNSKGRPMEVKTYVPLAKLVDDIRTIGWPKTAPGMGLFGSTIDPSGDERVYQLTRTTALFGFLKSRVHVAWTSEEVLFQSPVEARWVRAVKEAEFFDELESNCPNRYTGFSQIPHEPRIAGFYYPEIQIPKPSESFSTLNEFLNALNPETQIDRWLLLAAIVTPGWGGPPGSRPLFVLASDHGQGSGKTETLKAISEIWGGYYPLSTEIAWRDNAKAMMNSADWLTRVAAWDNVKGKFDAGEIEGAVTAKTIHGHRMYVGTMNRYNDLTFFVTFNSPQMSRDLAERSVVIKLGRPRSGDFTGWWTKFMEDGDNRKRLLAEALAVLRLPDNGFDFHRFPDRWRAWQRGVLSRLPDADLGAIMESIVDRRKDIDSDSEDGASIIRAIAQGLRLQGLTEGIVPFSLLWMRNTLISSAAWKHDERHTAMKSNRQLANYVQRITSPLGVVHRHPRTYVNVDDDGRVLDGRADTHSGQRSPKYTFDWDAARRLLGDDLRADATGDTQTSPDVPI